MYQVSQLAGRQTMFSYVMGTQTVHIFSKGIGEIKEEEQTEILYRSVQRLADSLCSACVMGKTDCPDIF